jgi:hypothetical protein
MNRRVFLAALPTACLLGQTPTGDYVCPMDRDVRSALPGICPRCGMKLVLGIPDPVEYPVRMTARPRVVKPGAEVEVAFEVLDPVSGTRITHFEMVHEKLYHLFIVSDDLEYFAHVHPDAGKDGIFRLRTCFPKTGAYRIVSDFYPTGGTPQISTRTLITSGYTAPAARKLMPDLAPKTFGDVRVELVTDPAPPLAGQRTLLDYRVTPAAGLEKYLGAWGHLLAASDDLIDTIHTHPFVEDNQPRLQFRIIFPREATYRVWMQFQRYGQVYTVPFTIPVSRLK